VSDPRKLSFKHNTLRRLIAVKQVWFAETHGLLLSGNISVEKSQRHPGKDGKRGLMEPQ